MRGIMSTFEWLCVLGLCVPAAVTAVIFLFGAFDAKGAAQAVENRLQIQLARVERKQDSIIHDFNVKVIPAGKWHPSATGEGE